MVVQTSYSNTLPVGGEGKFAFERDRASVITKQAASAIPFGRVVKYDGSGNVELPSATGAAFQGIALYEERQPDSNDVAQFAAGDAVSVLRNGYVYMRSEDALVPGAAVFVRYATDAGAAQKPGMLKSATGTTKADAWTALQVIEGCSAGGLAVIRINL
jgi:membrane-associated protease RseP (regulator of RpoE activity)